MVTPTLVVRPWNPKHPSAQQLHPHAASTKQSRFDLKSAHKWEHRSVGWSYAHGEQSDGDNDNGSGAANAASPNAQSKIASLSAPMLERLVRRFKSREPGSGAATGRGDNAGDDVQSVSESTRPLRDARETESLYSEAETLTSRTECERGDGVVYGTPSNASETTLTADSAGRTVERV